jgi:hypothetical protein
MNKCRPIYKLLSLAPCPLSLLIAIGCSDTQRSTTRPTTRTSDAALNDPFGNWSKVDTDISGGNTNQLDKDGMKRDVDRILLK